MPSPSYAFKKKARGLDLLKSVRGSDGLGPSSRDRIRRPSEKYFDKVLKTIGDSSMEYVERTQAIVEMSQLLDMVPQDSISEVWFTAHPLVSIDVPRATRRATLELLRECVTKTKDDFIKSIFFQIIYDCLVSSNGAGEKFTELDPDLDLILSSLNAMFKEDDELLDSDEKKLLTETVSDLTELELIKDSKCTHVSVVMELLVLAQKLTFPLNDSDVGNFIEILKRVSDSATVRTMNTFQTIAIRFLEKFLDQVHVDALDSLVLILLQISASMPPDKVETALIPLLNCILRSKHRLLLGEKLLMMPHGKKFDRAIIARCYADIYAQAVREGHVTANEAFHLLSKLFDAKVDDEFLRFVDLFLGVHSFLENWVSVEGSTGTILWSMIQEALVRFKGPSPSIVDKLLISVTNYPSLIPISPGALVHFISQYKTSIHIENLIPLFELRRWDFKSAETLNELTDLVMVPEAAPKYRLQFLRLCKSWFQETNDQEFQWNISQMNCLWNIYSKVESWMAPESELIEFGELLYTFLQLTTVDIFYQLLNTRLLPTLRKILLQKSKRRSFVGSLGAFGRVKAYSEERLRLLPILVKTLVKAFIWSPLEPTGSKCTTLFDVLISVYEYAEHCADSITLLTIARPMVRVRCDTEGNFYFADPEDAVGISSAFGRLKEQVAVGTSVQWTFPETLDFIDGNLLGERNEHVQFDSGRAGPSNGKINMGIWLSLAVGTIEDPADWEIYSYLLTHLCSQLSELTLFEGHYEEINKFKNVICQHLRQSLPSNIKPGDGLNRSDLNSAYVRNLSAVLAYNQYESKNFADDLVGALVFGLTSWEKTLIPILHILTVSCFEIPGSIKRYITPILLELQKRITTLHAIPSILEFLLALKSSPPLVSNLTLDETKRVFAIVFNLIENSTFLKERSKSFAVPPSASSSKLPPSSVSKNYDMEISPSTEGFLVGESMTRFFQYQSFMVLASWLSNVKADKMDELIPFVSNGLDKLAKIEDLKYDALAYKDFVLRLKFTNSNETPLRRGRDSDDFKTSTHLSRWIGENCLISIRTWETTNKVIVGLRRPSCECSFEVKPQMQLLQPKYKLFGFQDDEPQQFSSTTIKPEQILPLVCTKDVDSLIPLPSEDPKFNRSIGLLDRIPQVEFQKTGIIYLGPGQNQESQVLSNNHGSTQYNWFLSQIGDFIKLKETGRFFYKGGLDPETDGEYALVWNNATTQVTFHTVTLMPADNDLSFKKRHVGNNFVNIFYNESGLSSSHFNFNIIKSQFTFINIVVTPEHTGVTEKISQHYKVKIYRRSGVPGLLSCAHFKILNRYNLARYVRHVSLIANALAEKYNETGSQDACSIWGVRCKQLLGIRERAANLNEGPSSF
ncbi:hypothetical protein ZYGR_0AD02640 [Zygosaccharomyces rouxii]|uniref:ZYRO0G12078p n=2 Tax=Zygosaccharomyces rouxii TaxID=4956 RepID=C5E0E7_ZYGRC|nr:uncharacterized protein ZYRO0G12078g [Zygosaccharomyces rouxii]KAH9202574.1 hypothetical protein LQ764DRAFT_26857 [Zygosaccharomyces rouxii]GAV51081.1 hypothetical protein ZYGR_0AD02640 [Zygosaccharomyces rouxii]CAR29581.1 ZYRO0G12078p [Zygosaccharomyces rouxii]